MIQWIEPGDAFPDPADALGQDGSTPGLVAVSRHLDRPTLLSAYRLGIFPWFTDDQPVLWWSPDPRMILRSEQFRVHRSFRKKLRTFRTTRGCEIRVDTAFAEVIQSCARSPRAGQRGTWIVPQMQQAYLELHGAGCAHSIETWQDQRLVGGLYLVAIGRAVFGESMFSSVSGASRVALAALMAMTRRNGIDLVDCQQNTAHLAMLGAREMARSDFCAHVALAQGQTAPVWDFEPVYWNHLEI